jgi:hypothetical protein
MIRTRIFVTGVGACAFAPHSAGDVEAGDVSAAAGDAGPPHPATRPTAKLKQTIPITPAASHVQRRTLPPDPLVCG